MIARLRRLPPRTVDVLISAGMLATLAVDLASGHLDGDDQAASAVAVGVIALLPLLRRSRPLAAIYGWALVMLVMAVALHPPSDVVVPFLGLFVFPYGAGRGCPAGGPCWRSPPSGSR